MALPQDLLDRIRKSVYDHFLEHAVPPVVEQVMTGFSLSREEAAGAWFREEYVPVVAMLREADMIGKQTETEAYMSVSGLRYMLLRTHEWDEEVIRRLRDELSR